MGVLKDRKGDIHVNVPVRGSLSAPEFHYGEAVWAAIRNMAIRLVALPFSLVGKLFFTEDSRIASVAIDPVTHAAEARQVLVVFLLRPSLNRSTVCER